jgi:hypothetical protein
MHAVNHVNHSILPPHNSRHSSKEEPVREKMNRLAGRVDTRLRSGPFFRHRPIMGESHRAEVYFFNFTVGIRIGLHTGPKCADL